MPYTYKDADEGKADPSRTSPSVRKRRDRVRDDGGGAKSSGEWRERKGDEAEAEKRRGIYPARDRSEGKKFLLRSNDGGCSFSLCLGALTCLGRGHTIGTIKSTPR